MVFHHIVNEVSVGEDTMREVLARTRHIVAYKLIQFRRGSRGTTAYCRTGSSTIVGSSTSRRATFRDFGFSAFLRSAFRPFPIFFHCSIECPCNGRGDLVLLLEYVGLLVCLAGPCKFWKASRSSPKVEVGVRARTPTNILCLLLRFYGFST